MSKEGQGFDLNLNEHSVEAGPGDWQANDEKLHANTVRIHVVL